MMDITTKTPEFSLLTQTWLDLHVSPNTRTTYGTALEVYREWLLGRNPIAAAQDVQSAIVYHQHLKAQYSISTTYTYMAAIKAFHTMLWELQVITLNVWKLVKVEAPPSESQTHALTSGEMDEVAKRAAALGPRTLLIIRLLYEVALRREEVAKLRTEDVERVGTGWALTVKGKGNKTAKVGISDDLAEAIIAFAGREPGWVFKGMGSAGHITPRTINNVVDSLEMDLHPHQFRHTHVTERLLDGESIQDVSRTVRHSSITTTMRYFSTAQQVERSTARKTKLERITPNVSNESPVQRHLPGAYPL